MSEDLQIKRHGLFGKTIEYQTDLALPELEERLKRPQPKHKILSFPMLTPIKYHYDNPAHLRFDIKAIIPVDIMTLQAAKVQGKVSRENELSHLSVTISLGWGVYLYFTFSLLLLLIAAYQLSDWSAESIGPIIITTLTAIVGFVSLVIMGRDALDKLDKLTHELIL